MSHGSPGKAPGHALVGSSGVKVLAVTNDFPPEIGGIGRYVYELYRRLPDHGIDVRVLAPDMPGAQEFDRSVADIEVVRYPKRLVMPSPKLTTTLEKLSADRDIITLGSTLPVGFAAAKVGLPLVLHTHNSEILYDRLPGTRFLFRRLVERASLVTVITEYTHAALSSVLDGSRVGYLSPAVDLERFRPDITGLSIRQRFGVPAEAPLIVHAGRLVPRKGQDALIEAMPMILRSLPATKLLLVGTGPQEARLRKQVTQLGLEASVIFSGFIDWSEVPEVFAAADVFATPCRSRFGRREVEGFGQVFLEAQAVGRPVIVGRSGGAPEATLDGVSGFVVDGEDVHLIADKAIHLLEDRERARRMGQEGRRYVESSFSWDLRAASFAEELRSTLGSEQVA